MRFSCLALVTVGLVACSFAVGCSSPPPKASKQDQVPANSLDDDRLHGTTKEKPPGNDPPPPEDTADPTQPFVQSVGDNSDPTAPATSGSAAGKNGKPPKGAPSAAPAGGGNMASKAECDKAFDKYISLEIATNPALKGATQDMIDQAKAAAKQQKGDEPCTATRAQYTCAMAAKSTAAWQTCMK